MKPTRIFIHYLHQFEKILIKIETFDDAQKNILTARLNPDMLPLISQIRTAINFSLRAICPMIDVELVQFTNDQETFAGVRAQLKNTLQFLETVTEEQFSNAQTTHVHEQAGFGQLNLPKDEFLHLYALPNFFFHFNMVYAIARNCGVPLSKGDYDGYHQYPTGFSFN